MMRAQTLNRVFVLGTLFAFFVILAACGGGGSGGGAPGDPDDPPATVDIAAAASRTSGVAPLGVFFNAAVDTQTDDFQGLGYEWDFGDPGSGVWAGSGVSRNVAGGPVAAHVFESAGTYTVTLTVRDGSGVIDTQTFVIRVQDPDTVYGGTDTVCVCRSGSDDFAGCPDGAQRVLLDDIDALPNHVGPNKRVLLRRGDTWTTSGSAAYREVSGPVTIGAYGDCQSPDDRGICANAPRIELTGDDTGGLFSLYRPSDWRIQDLHITGETTRWGAIGGSTDMQSVLLLRLKVEGFTTPLGNSHWDTDGHDQVMIVACDVSASGMNEVYVGSERLVVMGNQLRNPDTSHVLRVWQAYFGVIAHNMLSGASLNSDTGRHALKLHGPAQDILASAGDGQSGLVHPTRFVSVSGNIFGGSGPWPVCIGPQDSSQDERLRDILVEKNRFFSGYGDPSCCSSAVQVCLHLSAANVTVRNNIFDGMDSSVYFTAVDIGRRGVEPPPINCRIYNNTIYKSDLPTGYTSLRGIVVNEDARQTRVQNNLVHLPADATELVMILNHSTDLVSDHNLLTDAPALADPDNSDYLLKDYRLLAGSPAIDQGASVPVWEDFDGVPRNGLYDIGACER